MKHYRGRPNPRFDEVSEIVHGVEKALPATLFGLMLVQSRPLGIIPVIAYLLVDVSGGWGSVLLASPHIELVLTTECTKELGPSVLLAAAYLAGPGLSGCGREPDVTGVNVAGHTPPPAVCSR
jgi:hypothetical protein